MFTTQQGREIWNVLVVVNLTEWINSKRDLSDVREVERMRKSSDFIADVVEVDRVRLWNEFDAARVRIADEVAAAIQRGEEAATLYELNEDERNAAVDWELGRLLVPLMFAETLRIICIIRQESRRVN